MNTFGLQHWLFWERSLKTVPAFVSGDTKFQRCSTKNGIFPLSVLFSALEQSRVSPVVTHMCRAAPPGSRSARWGSRCGPAAGRSGTARWFSRTNPRPATAGRSCWRGPTPTATSAQREAEGEGGEMTENWTITHLVNKNQCSQTVLLTAHLRLPSLLALINTGSYLIKAVKFQKPI